MKRRAAQVTLAIGVLLGVVAGVALVRGFRVTDFWTLALGQNPAIDVWIEHRAVLATSHSICAVLYSRTRSQATDESMRGSIDRFGARHETGRARPFTEPAQRHGWWWQRLGFEVVWWTSTPEPIAWGTVQRTERGLILPTWFVALLAAVTIVPARYLRKQRRLRLRRAAGQCLTCGYDLRGAEHARCPECGAGLVTQQV